MKDDSITAGFVPHPRELLKRLATGLPARRGNAITWLGVLMLLCGMLPAVAGDSPKDAFELWSKFDFRKEPLKVEVVKEWTTDEGTVRFIRYALGTIEGDNRTISPVVAAYYGFPKSDKAKKFPAIIHLHGGGQRATKERVQMWMRLGYAALSMEWGGGPEKDLPGTDWMGTRIHNNSADPEPTSLYKEAHGFNSSWLLYAFGARRGITFLEQQPEVDPERIGVEGHSMGGDITVIVAMDERVAAAAPSVGGTGYLYQEYWGAPGSGRARTSMQNIDVFEKFVGREAYWPFIKHPILFLGATDDFNSPTEWIFRGMATLPPETPRRVALAPHYNHAFTPASEAARTMWFESHLKNNFDFPAQARAELVLKTQDGIPSFHVWPTGSKDAEVQKVDIYYGYTRNPLIRFWRDGMARKAGDHYEAACPVFDTGEPLFAFANITYRIKKRPGVDYPEDYPPEVAIISDYRIAYPDDLKAAGVKATEKPQRLIDDFSRGMHDWYQKSADSPQHFEFGLRKLLDPSWMGPKGGALAFDVTTTRPGNKLGVSIHVNEWQAAATKRRRDVFVAFADLPEAGVNQLVLKPDDFKNDKGQPLRDWDEITRLTIQPANCITASGAPKKRAWEGAVPVLGNMRWEGGTFIKRPYPHQKRGNEAARPASAAADEFQDAVKESVQRENQDEKTRNPRHQRSNQ